IYPTFAMRYSEHSPLEENPAMTSGAIFHLPETRTVCPISRIEVIPLSVPESDRNDLDGLVETVIVKIHDEAGCYGFGETDAPPSVIKALIETPTAHGWSRNISEILVGEDPIE